MDRICVLLARPSAPISAGQGNENWHSIRTIASDLRKCRHLPTPVLISLVSFRLFGMAMSGRVLSCEQGVEQVQYEIPFIQSGCAERWRPCGIK